MHVVDIEQLIPDDRQFLLETAVHIAQIDDGMDTSKPMVAIIYPDTVSIEQIYVHAISTEIYDVVIGRHALTFVTIPEHIEQTITALAVFKTHYNFNVFGLLHIDINNNTAAWSNYDDIMHHAASMRFVPYEKTYEVKIHHA
jgi:hypothetical protein